MRGQWVVRGVPESIRTDGWWLEDRLAGGRSDPPPFPTTRRSGKDNPINPAALGVVIALTVTADLLFWDAPPGLSVAVYAVLLSGCILAFKPGGVTRREAALGMAFTVLSNLPVIEQVQFLSLAFSLTGLVALLGWVAFGCLIGAWPSLVTFARASTLGAVALPVALADKGRETRLFAPGIAKAVALPISVGTLFLVLFTTANPLLEGMLSELGHMRFVTVENILRLTFWIVVACVAWPYLNTADRWRGKAAPMPVINRPMYMLAGLINAGSVRSSLILFNAMFAVQTLTDLSVLTGGISLPEGLSYAEYAHRGAYPLVVTALLSGLFAIATHHLTQANRLLRALMLLWLGQNMVLVLTALFRLELYVDAYMLTYLRVAAFIWMGLTFGSLVLIVAQILKGQTLGWLVGGVMQLTTATLYACCFINFAYVIADYNMTALPDGRLDLGYLCEIGEQAIPAMMDYGQITDNVACGQGGLPSIRFDPINDWRDWGFRRWRLQRYLETYHDL